VDTRLMQQIKKILQEFPQYWDNEELQRTIVIEDLKRYDALLISALLKNQKIRENYTVKAGNVVIFKIQEFVDLLRYKDYWTDSYTKYSNTIGLSSEGKYLQYNTDVVLDFPYKDCILEAGMTKEDTGKKEVFYNEVIAKDEIDTLLAPKAFVNVKKFNSEGEHEIDFFSDDDNLMIKGNNLLALYSLKERFAGKVKCIYIDPPYNTGGDSFKYNDRFNHSTWLSFIKNRLEIARELLSNDGSIWINIDDDESHYLKVLSDEIFGRDNFVANFIWEKKYAPQNSSKYVSDMHDHILMYAKDVNNLQVNGLPRTSKMDARYKNPDNDSRGVWQSDNLLRKDEQKSGMYEIITPANRKVSPPPGTSWRVSKEKYKELLKDNRIWFGSDGLGVPRLKRFLNEVAQNAIAGTIWKYSEVAHNQEAKRELVSLFGTAPFNTPKPEKLLNRILLMASNEKDIVLDFFMGSATTQAVAMKMNRRFIGIEQMDYINTVSVPRLQKVINGEHGGISKDIDWQGGGSFIYAELMELNQFYMNRIDQASTKEQLADLWEELDNNADLNFQLDKDRLTKELLKDYDESDSITFNDLTFDEQKEIFKKALDKNQLYVPYSEIDDANVIISENDKVFNHSFYSNEGE